MESIAPVKDIARRELVRAPQRLPFEAALSRSLDLMAAALALCLFSPVMVIVALMVALERRGPIIFRHSRIGLGGRRFPVLKFRSMRMDADQVLAAHLATDEAAAQEWARDHKLKNDPRITPLGRFLRKSSLDELPQFLNVLVGHMSIVGPRPIVEAEVRRYGRFFQAYCSVRPGITGVWQVSGRSNVTYRRRVAMDALYARRKSVLLDIRLIVATVPAVLMRTGSY